MKDVLGLETGLIPRIASPFGGGMGRHGLVCGAVTGGLMSLGLLQGRDSSGDSEGKDRAYAAASHFLSAFSAEFGEVDCRLLIGYNLLDPNERQQAKESKVFDEKCRQYLAWVADFLATKVTK